MNNFLELYRRLLRIDYAGVVPGSMPADSELAILVNEGALLLPHAYIENYADLLQKNLPRLSQLVSAQQLPSIVVETLAGAVHQHRPASGRTDALHRFLAVVSNFYRSFLDGRKRAAVNVPIRGQLPPLAVFQNDSKLGPFTVAVEETAQLIGAEVGLASLPATYAADPLIWAILAHETGGHSIMHADPGLVRQLGAGLPAAFKGFNFLGQSAEQFALLWTYWIEEAAADVYGVLNVGPAFAPNMAAYFSAVGARGTIVPPKLRMETRYRPGDPNMVLDPHPTDILRLHLIAGAVDASAQLSLTTRAEHLRIIEDLANLLATGSTVKIKGSIPIDRDHFQMLELEAPLGLLQQMARTLGAYIATTKLDSLNGHSIQEIETWDDSDESRSQAVKDALLSGQSIVALGDDAHLLAGATMALLDKPSLYDGVTLALNAGLDDSYRRDPVWGQPQLNPIYTVYQTTSTRNFWPARTITPARTVNYWRR
jgi:hypothetical protein